MSWKKNADFLTILLKKRFQNEQLVQCNREKAASI